MWERALRLWRSLRPARQPTVPPHFEADVARALERYAERTGTEVRYVPKSHPVHYRRRAARVPDTRQARPPPTAAAGPDPLDLAAHGATVGETVDGARRAGDGDGAAEHGAGNQGSGP
jgi:hypothetical protein